MAFFRPWDPFPSWRVCTAIHLHFPRCYFWLLAIFQMEEIQIHKHLVRQVWWITACCGFFEGGILNCRPLFHSGSSLPRIRNPIFLRIFTLPKSNSLYAKRVRTNECQEQDFDVAIGFRERGLSVPRSKTTNVLPHGRITWFKGFSWVALVEAQ